MLKLAGVSVRVEGVENLALDGAFIIVANHESWFDVWALAGCLPIDARFVAKKELERVPPLRTRVEGLWPHFHRPRGPRYGHRSP